MEKVILFSDNCFNIDASTFYLHCLTVGTCFSAREIPWENVIAFSSDNCSVMKGRHNSVLTRIKNVQPHVLDIGCICHLANLCCQQGVKQLPLPVDELLIDVYYHFAHSAKRKEQYREFLAFCDVEPLKILKHASTRWLSLERCVNRFLQQWPALLSYFQSHDDVERPGRIQRCAKYLGSVEMKAYFRFLSFILQPLNVFNMLFQTDARQIALLMPEMTRLLRLFMAKFIKMRTIKAADDLTTVSFSDPSQQLDDDTIAVGMEIVPTTSMTPLDSDSSPVCGNSMSPLSRRWLASFHSTTRHWKNSLCWTPTRSCGTAGTRRPSVVLELDSASSQLPTLMLWLSNSRTTSWVPNASCQRTPATHAPTASGPRWANWRHSLVNHAFRCWVIWWPLCPSLLTATPTVSVCSRCVGRLTPTLVLSWVMTPYALCCPVRSTQTSRVMRLSQMLICWSVQRRRLGTMCVSTSSGHMQCMVNFTCWIYHCSMLMSVYSNVNIANDADELHLLNIPLFNVDECI